MLFFLPQLISVSQGSPPFLEKSLHNQQSTTLQEYSFSDLGFLPPTLDWAGIGAFNSVINVTFDLPTKGPVLLIIEYSVQGDKPHSLGYHISGTFNGEFFEVLIPRARLSYIIDSNAPQQLVIPLDEPARFLQNSFSLNISCSEETSETLAGTFIVHSASKFLIGNVLILDAFGNFPVPIFPAVFKGYSTIGSGVEFKSFIQLTIENESLACHSKYQISLTLKLSKQVSVSLSIRDKNNQVVVLEKNETTKGTVVATAKLYPYLGVSVYELDLTVFSGSLWTTEFEITIEQCKLSFYKEGRLFGFDSLEIPFFIWPSAPIVGVVVLVLWFLPYSVLKYREWKKVPEEFQMAVPEEEEDNLNIFDPEGFAEDSLGEDDIDDTLESLEDE